MRGARATISQPVIGAFCVDAPNGWTIKTDDQALAAQIAQAINDAADAAYAAGQRQSRASILLALGLSAQGPHIQSA